MVGEGCEPLVGKSSGPMVGEGCEPLVRKS